MDINLDRVVKGSQKSDFSKDIVLKYYFDKRERRTCGKYLSKSQDIFF